MLLQRQAKGNPTIFGVRYLDVVKQGPGCGKFRHAVVGSNSVIPFCFSKRSQIFRGGGTVSVSSHPMFPLELPATASSGHRYRWVHRPLGPSAELAVFGFGAPPIDSTPIPTARLRSGKKARRARLAEGATP